MLPVLSRAQSRQLDEVASVELGVPALILMENAGRGAAEVILASFPAVRRVVVVCGRGNNGGDGFVVARRLLTLGLAVRVVCVYAGNELDGDADLCARAFAGAGGVVVWDSSDEAQALQVELVAAELVVDAVFGTGLTRPLAGRLARAVEHLNTAQRPIVALDVPSGLNADTGKVLGAAVRAAVTVTFNTHKLGLLTQLGREHAGQVVVGDIGVRSDTLLRAGKFVPRAELVQPADVALAVARLGRPAHKGEAGRVVVIAGSQGTVGAARLVAHGAHRAGAGLVTVASFADCITRLESSAWETMTRTLTPRDDGQSLTRALASADSVVVGPGLGLSDDARDACERVVLQCERPVVVDADALNHFGGDIARISTARGPRLLTPHPKEAARLLACSPEDVEADRYAAVEQLARQSGATVLLKGAHSLIQSTEGLCYVNSTGNSALAVGGSGDVLSGIIAAFGSRLPLLDAALVAAWLHGRAAEYVSRRRGTERGMLAREIADDLPAVLAEVSSPA
jgi:ADP-dependent NAD(P)H-hydrate dehydratase / NAD(P)H-hydrate epimerase